MPLLRGKIYSDATSESLRQYILHVDRIMIGNKTISIYPMHDLIITYFDNLMGLLQFVTLCLTKDIVSQTFQVTFNFAKLCLRHDIGNE